MPTNRPFFSSFLAVFRAHSTLSKPSSTTTTPSSPSPSSQSPTFSPPTLTSARGITTKSPSQSGATATTTALQTATSLTHRSPISHSPPTTTTTTFNPTAQRRGSDTSSDGGFRDALGGEKWFVGGRTAAGEERYYRLGMVRKERSGDRLSMDRLSL